MISSDDARKLLVDTGIELLKTGLVARTWGNISARISHETCVITPSGLDYTQTKEKDIVVLDIITGQWQGSRKPSGERGVHRAAYQTYDDVGFVIHTHQPYASAIGLAGFDRLDITEEEQQTLGGIALAGYGLSGTKTLINAVKSALQSGAQTVLMIHHGALICGRDKEQAMTRATLLEEISRRNLKGQPKESITLSDSETSRKEQVLSVLKERYPYVDIVQSPEVMALSEKGKTVSAQLDDMAQMIGSRIPAVEQDIGKIRRAMVKHGAILVKGLGGVIKAETADDAEALKLLFDKTAIARLHTDALGSPVRLGSFDCWLMHLMYLKKYAKQKNA